MKLKTGASAFIRRLLVEERGDGTLTTYLLLAAAGAVMVGLTVPSLFGSAKSAAGVLDNQVRVLEQGANPGGGSFGGGGASSDWTLEVGSGGVKVSGAGMSVGVTPGGNVSGSVSAGGVTVSANNNGVTASGGGGGGGGSGGGGSSSSASQGTGNSGSGSGTPIINGNASVIERAHAILTSAF
jgi:hypothetical protein